MSQAGSVLIVGGGIVGLACAFEALRRGYEVTVLEAGRIGGQASGAAAGMLAPYSENTEQPDAFFRLCLESLKLYPAWIREVEEASGCQAEWVRSGSLNVYRHEADLLPLQGRLRWHNEWGARAELVEGRALWELEPLLADDVRAAVYTPEESHIYAPKLVSALEVACRKLGAAIMEGAGAVKKLEESASGGVTLWMEQLAQPVRAERVVFCSGAWSGQFERWLGIAIPIHPIRGQICSFAGSMEEVRHMVFSSQAYWVGKRNGSIVCGASEDVAGFRTDVTEKGIGRLVDSSSRLFPFLAARDASHRWAGLRPATRDGLPLIGTIPGRPSWMMAAGHYRNGILLSPVTARLVADMLDGRADARELAPFAPGRFTPVANG